MRSKENLCPVTGAQCYAPDCTDKRCDFKDPDEWRYNPPPEPATASEPALEGRVENLEKATTDIYWQIKQLKEKWEGKKNE